jgi:hypothetical protein
MLRQLAKGAHSSARVVCEENKDMICGWRFSEKERWYV